MLKICFSYSIGTKNRRDGDAGSLRKNFLGPRNVKQYNFFFLPINYRCMLRLNDFNHLTGLSQKMNAVNFTEEEGNEEEDLSKDGGVLKEILKEGKGELIKDGFEVKLNYQGKLADGRVFDSSLTRKKPFSFIVGEGKVISGWEIGVKSMRMGEKAKFYISSKYGYKKKGIPPIIPPNADLFFEIEILDITENKKNILVKPTSISNDTLQVANEKNLTNKNYEEKSLSQKFFFISPFSSQSGEKAPWWLNPNITFFLIFLLIMILFVVVYSLGGINHSFDNPSSILDSEDNFM